MSQIMARPHRTILQDVIPEPKPYITSDTCAASCHVCDRGLARGCSLTAKVIGGETVLLCDAHFSKDY